MTKREHWDEQKIEQRLSELPKIKDDRSKEDLYKIIQHRLDEIEDNSSDKRKKPWYKRQWFFPSIASACVLLLFVLILPSFLKDNEQSLGEQTVYDKELNVSTDDMRLATNENALNNEPEIYTEENEVNMAENKGTEEVEEMDTNMDIHDEEKEVHLVAIPFVEDVEMEGMSTFKVMIDHVEHESFPNKEDLLLFSFSTNEIDGAEKLEDLQNIYIDEKENEVTLDFYENNRFESLSSAETEIFREVVTEVLGLYGFEKVHFTTNGEPGLMIGQIGLEYTWELPHENRGYYLYENEEGEQFVVRAVSIGAWSMEEEGDLTLFETLEKMKNVTHDAWYTPLIPEGVDFQDISIEDNEAIITLAEQTQLAADDVNRFLQGVTLAASDFSIDYVTFTGEKIDDIFAGRVTERIPVLSIDYLQNTE